LNDSGFAEFRPLILLHQSRASETSFGIDLTTHPSSNKVREGNIRGARYKITRAKNVIQFLLAALIRSGVSPEGCRLKLSASIEGTI
jgi:hypothetical protein